MLNKEICKQCQLKAYTEKIELFQHKISYYDYSDKDPLMENPLFDEMTIENYKNFLIDFNGFWESQSLTRCPLTEPYNSLHITSDIPEKCYYILEQTLQSENNIC